MITRIGPKTPRRNFLAQWRKQRGLTQDQLAERLGTHKGQISNWENGRRALTDSALQGIAEALDIDPAAVYRDPGRPSVDELLRGQPPEIIEQAYGIVQLLVQKR